MSERHREGESSSVAVFDRGELMDRVGHDEEFLEMVVETYLDDIPNQIEALRGALDNQDGALVAKKGHALKGASANAAALVMMSLAESIELAGKGGDLQEARTQFERLRGELDRFRAGALG